jgi:hypothetical protein
METVTGKKIILLLREKKLSIPPFAPAVVTVLVDVTKCARI